MRIAVAQCNPVVGDLKGNCAEILCLIKRAKQKKAALILFPELALLGYPPDDFLLLPNFIRSVQTHLQEIAAAAVGIVVVVGAVRVNPGQREKPLHNTAAICRGGKVIGYQDKALLPTYDVFDERRYFEPAHTHTPFSLCGMRVGVTICEDIWEHTRKVPYTEYHTDPIETLKGRVDLLLNLSASPYSVGKERLREKVCMGAAQTLGCPVVLCNQVGGNDSLIFDGRSAVYSPEGAIAFGKAFSEDLFFWDLFSSLPVLKKERDETGDLFQALVLGVKDYFEKQGFQKACLGLSGGIDSAVVACIASQALGSDRVFGVTMPSKYSSTGSVDDSIQLATALGMGCVKVPIHDPFTSFLELLAPHFVGHPPSGVTEENLQARIRGVILMAFSNKLGHLVLSTGNKSEMALGYSTLYGDMCGGLGVLADVTKGQVYQLARWINQTEEVIPQQILEKPPSAELREGQLDSDALPPYEVIDQVVSSYVEKHLSPSEIAQTYRIDPSLVDELVQKIHQNEYKRRQSAPSLRVSPRAFSVGYRFPIVQGWVV